jgi:hypothetical protein
MFDLSDPTIQAHDTHLGLHNLTRLEYRGHADAAQLAVLFDQFGAPVAQALDFGPPTAFGMTQHFVSQGLDR